MERTIYTALTGTNTVLLRDLVKTATCQHRLFLQISMSVLVLKPTNVIQMPCAPTLKDRLCVDVKGVLLEMVEIAQVKCLSVGDRHFHLDAAFHFKFIFQIGTLNPHGINERFSFN